MKKNRSRSRIGISIRIGAVAVAVAVSVSSHAERRLQFERAREPFAAGLALIRRSLPPPGRDDETLRKIRSLLEFHAKSVAWGEQIDVKPDGSRTIVMENAPPDPAATIVVVTSGGVPEGFSLRTEGTRLWVYEYPTTSAWAALMLLHELAHVELAARSTKEQDNTEWLADELVAYQLELGAADLISKGRVSAAIGRFLKGMKASEPEALFREFDAITIERHEELLASLQEAMGSRDAKSTQERNLRNGFAMTSVGLVRYRGDRTKLMNWMEALTRAHGTEAIKERFEPDKSTPAPQGGHPVHP